MSQGSGQAPSPLQLLPVLVWGARALTLRMAGWKLCARRLRPLRSRWKPRSSRAEAWAPLPGPCTAGVGADGCCLSHRLVRAPRSRSHRSNCMAWGWRAGQGHGGSSPAGVGGACGARGRLRAALPRHCTHLTRAMQQQCTSGPPAPGPTPTPATPHTPPSSGAGNHWPWTQALARQPSQPGPQSCSCGLTPRLLQPGRERPRSGKAATRRPARALAPPSPCQWRCRLRWWPGCPAGTHWPSHRGPGWPGWRRPSCGPAGPAQP